MQGRLMKERDFPAHARFDDFLKGDDRALSAAELAGLNLFLTSGRATCHNGVPGCATE